MGINSTLNDTLNATLIYSNEKYELKMSKNGNVSISPNLTKAGHSRKYFDNISPYPGYPLISVDVEDGDSDAVSLKAKDIINFESKLNAMIHRGAKIEEKDFQII